MRTIYIERKMVKMTILINLMALVKMQSNRCWVWAGGYSQSVLVAKRAEGIPEQTV
jgi:hypothetical protein